MQQTQPLTGSAAAMAGASARARGRMGRMRSWTVRGLLLSVVAALGMPAALRAPAQTYPGLGCVATLENRSVPVDATGSYSLPNVPVDPGKYRVRVICPQPNGTTLGSTSDFQDLVPLGMNQVPTLPLGAMDPQPSSLKIVIIAGTLSSVGSTVQLQLQAIQPDGYANDESSGAAGATYSSSNLAVATVSADGLVTATGPGNVVITARYDGLTSTRMLTSFALADSDGDGLPDAYEIANGLNPFDPTDANQDPDHDGLTNLQEYQLGTNPHVADTDGDGLNDGDEIARGTNPLVADTDGDGLSDGDEVRLGTNPLNPDTDGDGIPDGVEVKLGLNPLVPDVTTTVTGHVTKGDGSPYFGATAVLLTYFTTITDSTGAFTILHVPTTLGNLVVSARVVQGTTVLSGASSATIAVPNGTTDVGTIQLGQSVGMVSGVVTSPDNHPVALAQVTVVSGADTRTTTTDQTGLYVVSGLQAGQVGVAVFDPATSLRGQVFGVLSGGGPLTLNVKLAGYGTVAGTVRNTNGTPVGAGVLVTIAGALNTTTATDTLGHYSFAFVPLGSVQIDATDANGNHGRASVTVTATAQNINADVQYLGRGTVSGVVSDGTNTPVAGAIVTLNNGGVFGQQLTATTDSLGHYSFANVFVGTIYLSATQVSTSTGGTAMTNVQSDGQSVTANIQLQPTATISGTIFRADGTTVVSGAVVTLQGTALSGITGSDGKYTIANVPLRTYTAMVLDPATGDRGSGSAVLNTAGQTVTTNINLVGLGTLVVTVVDGGGATVSGALVSVTTNNPFNIVQNGVTAADGTVTFNQQLAGGLTVTASNPATGLGGTANVTVTPNNTANVTVHLQASGSVQGTVRKIDGVTPLAGATVQLDGGLTVMTNASGMYTLPLVATGTHRVAVLDAQNNTLAFNNNVVVATQGQVVTANFVIVGRGTVVGQVTRPDGSAAANVPVALTSQVGGYGNAVGTQTDVNGSYAIALVPVGPYTVVAQEHSDTVNSYGTANGAMTAEGATVTTNIQLSSQLVPAVTTFTDANGESYPLRQNGGLFDGSFSVFAGDSATHEGGSLLSLVQNGTETAFTGAAFAPVSLNAQQISIEQDGLDGLNVTRRVYVPGDGYFARYLELLKNPTAQDITVDVKLTSNYRNNIIIVRSNSSFRQQDPPHILLTSSGDTLLNVTDPSTPDHWVTFGGATDQDPFLPDVYADQYIPPVADVFDGPSAKVAVTNATYTTDAADTYSALTETYGAVKIPAGATVGILHFVSEQNGYAAANASAARLVQLPPESLAGLAESDLVTIQNFSVPDGGKSQVAALPPLTNTVGGYVYAADGSTVVPGAGIAYQSTDPIFSRTYVGQSDSTGAYSFTGTFHGLAIPSEGFKVTATHPQTQVVSPTFTGAFATGATAAAQNILFSNTGTLKGTVSRGPTVLNVAGTVTISGGGLGAAITLPIAADGTYIFTGLPVGTYVVVANVTNTLLTGQTSATIAVGQTTTQNITIGESGNVQGTVTRANNSLAVGDYVNLRQAGSASLSVQVDTSGHYSFTDVPIGTYTVDSYDSLSNAAASATVVVTTNATTTQNLALVSSGSVTGVVTVNDGSSVANLTITLTSTTSNGTQSLSTTTDSMGHYSFTNVTPGTIQLRTTTPAGLQGVANGSLPLAGQQVVLNLSLTAAGSLTGTVFQADGHTPAVGVQVMLSPAPLTGSATTTTDANGMYSYNLVAIGDFAVYATNTTTGDRGQAAGQIQTNGQARVINVTLNGVGTLTVMVQDASSHPIANASVTVTNQPIQTQYTVKSDATGAAKFTNIFAGLFYLSANDPVTGLNAYTSGTLAAGGNQTITVKLQPAGNIQGVVYAPDGVTPVAGATVGLSFGPTTTTAADGSYRFNSVQLSTYTITARDTNGLLRASDSGIQLQNNGDTVTHNLTFIGLGTVTGTVTKVDGTPLENAQLLIASANPTIGGNTYVTTGGDGTYSFASLPVGNFTVTVTNLDPSLAGFGHGTISADGASVVVNIQLVSSTVTLPVTLTDADGYTYTISGGGVYTATGQLGGLNPFYSAQTLQLGNASFGSGGAPTSSYQSLNGQQIEINQPSIAGLNVTRKVYVPTDGYFSRRLDVLQNTTSSPITVTVNIGGPERYVINGSSQVITTSNGTATVNNSILWAVDDDDTGTLPYPRSQPALANVFAGTGAALPPSQVTSTVYYSGFYGSGFNTYELHYWNYIYTNVVVPANSTVSFLMFTAQEATSMTAATAAQRLEQLPAEALAGLTSSDLASVANFAIPSAPLAAVQPPTTTGTLSGHVLAGDGTTPIPNAKVYAQSTDLYYGSGTTATADATGLYSTPPFLASSYVAEALDLGTGTVSVPVTGTYPANSVNQTQDIPFTGTGIVQGQVTASGTTTFVSGSAYLQWTCGNGYCGSTNIAFGPDGKFTALTIPAGYQGYNVYVNTPQGGSISIPGNGQIGFYVTANTTTPITLQLPGTGTITGTVTNADGTPAAGATVGINGQTAYFGESTHADANGNFVFASVPPDMYNVASQDPVTQSVVQKMTTVTVDTTSTVNLQYIGKGTVVATVHYANGNLGQNVVLYISTSTVSQFTYFGNTDGTTGQFTFNNVPTGAYTIRAYYPGTNFYSVTTNTMVGNNNTIQQAVTLPPVGTISGKVTNADGSPSVGAYVQMTDNMSQFSMTPQTDSAGNYAAFPVPADRTVTVQTSLPNNTTGRTIQAVAANQQVPGDGQTLTVNLRFPGLATVKVTALKADNTPYTAGYLFLKSKDGTQNYTYKTIGSDGSFTFTSVVEGQMVASYTDIYGVTIGSKVFTVGASDDGTTVNVTINTPPSGDVLGHVYAADGTTPLNASNFNVNLLDIDTGAQYSAANTGNAYDFANARLFEPNIQVGASGFTVSAQVSNVPSQLQPSPVTFNGNITTEGQTITHDFTLPVGVVSGTIYLNDGVTPLPYSNINAVVTVNGTTYNYGVQSDQNGNYQIAGLVAGPVTLTATDNNGIFGTTTFTLASNTTIRQNTNISLGPVGSVSGTIYDANGIPLPNTQVDITETSGTVYGSFYTSVNTDSNGFYMATDVPVGTVVVTVYPDGQPSITNSGQLVNNGDAVTINIGNPPPQPTGQVFGTVYDSDQNPAPQATVTVTPADGSVTPITVMTDDNGMYVANGVPVGDVSVAAVLNDGSTTVPATTGTVADVNTPVEIDLGLTDYGQVSGNITDSDGNQVGDMDVFVASTGDPDSVTGEQSFDDGFYIFGGIPAGTVTITVKLHEQDVTIGTATGVLPYGGNVVVNVTVDPTITGHLMVKPQLRVVKPEGDLAQAKKPTVKQPAVPDVEGSHGLALLSAGVAGMPVARHGDLW